VCADVRGIPEGLAMQIVLSAVRKYAMTLVVLLSGAAHAQSTPPIQVIPSAPRYLEPVYLRTNTGTSLANGARVSMVNGSLVVDFDWSLFLGPPPQGGWTFDASLGSFPAGTYTVSANTSGGRLTTQFTVSPREAMPAPSVDFTGMWWNPQESGWGMSIFQGPTNKLFAVWFVYDASGAPTWYTLQPGAWSSAQSFSGPIYRTTGPYFVGPFDASQVKVEQVGNGTFTFWDSAHAHFQYTIGSQSMRDKALERQPVE
jgi:hypothetical protein